VLEDKELKLITHTNFFGEGVILGNDLTLESLAESPVIGTCPELKNCEVKVTVSADFNWFVLSINDTEFS